MTLQLAPFIDVMLFLLVFFILTWQIARYEAELSVSLPVAEEGERSKRLPGEILLNLTRDGTVIINRSERSDSELESILTQITADFPDQAVILRADAATPYQEVIRVIDICKKAKVWNIAFTTKPPDKE